MKAVDIPELRHLSNVVVFSSAGKRPDQHKLSLGDLDGDLYSVMWDKEIVNSFWENHPPHQNQKQTGTALKSLDPIDNILNYL